MGKSIKQLEKDARECKQLFLDGIKGKGFYASCIMQASMEVFLSVAARCGLSFKILKAALEYNKDIYESLLKKSQDEKD